MTASGTTDERAGKAEEQGLLARFFAFNKRLSAKTERYLPQAGKSFLLEYEEAVGRYMNERPGLTVVDVGGGKICPFVRFRDPSLNTTIIAVDITEEELRCNQDVDRKIVADVTRELPLDDCSVDLMVSRAVLEHLPDTEAFFRQAHRVLADGGRFVHWFPSRYAPFALANRLLSNRFARKLLYFFHPGSEGYLGFPAYYDHCTVGEMERALKRNGYQIEQIQVNYYQAHYYNFFYPLYLAMAGYEILIRALGLKALTAYVLVTAVRKSDR